MKLKRLSFAFLLFVILASSPATANNSPACETLYFPIDFDQYGLPYIGLMIDNSVYRAHVDLGASHALHLPQKMLSKIPNLKPTGKLVETLNVAGESFTAKQYTIPTLTVKCMDFNNLTALELKNWGAKLGATHKEHNNKDIIIGADFFHGKTIQIDYKRRLLTVFGQDEKLNTPSDLNESLSFERSVFGISISLSSGVKYYQMVLDTGASASLISANRIDNKERISSCQFVVSEHIECQYINTLLMAYGLPFRSKLYLYPITEKFQYDGILGRDFFQQFIVTLNFSNNTITLTSA
ncbi:aspartyl protease family protein [Thalassotalea marina]|uniref:Retropepsins domain-containing protein n=1 Tax=Thalassotalea marina TaxID=1673741 RepID=A0A919ELR8_9GAMM|nr:aspartyl protease family protein [Thalassotalea marina]GHF96112.1 hypothetical protein GCM10017161_25570 [Thalassotalea marina]